MPDYDLSRLTSRSFEHLIQALAARVMGAGIVVFGDGPDGGREATFERKVPFPSLVDPWEGYGVLQAKFRQRSGNTQQDGSWAVNQLKEELEKYTDPDSNLRKPDYFIYATNVVLTPVSETGSKDRIIAALEDFKNQSSLRDYAVWDCDQIRSFLDAYEDVRKAYAGFITPGDVLAALISRLDPTPVDMYDTLVMFLEREMLSDECVNLEQAGHDVEERIPLATVFVDLPTHSEPAGAKTQVLDHSDPDSPDTIHSFHAEEGFIKDILAVSSDRLDPASTGTSAISDSLESGGSRDSRGRFVLIGGPGQGKTTLTQFICQIFRAAIISGKHSYTLSPELRDTLAIIQEHCKTEDINHIVVPRFPFKIILNDFAKALSTNSTSEVNSVFAYLTRQIANRTNTDISVADLRRFLGLYPSVIIFDGLDEVPASSNRDEVLDAIKDFWLEASNANADILAIATSRPQGYNEDFSPSYYHHRQLAELSHELGWHFAQRLAEVRYRTDEDRKGRVLDRLKRALLNRSTARLMRSPLQVTIMTALVDRIGQPPQARWNLFNSYYEVIYQREVERSIPASNILREYEPDIRAIHNQVGLILQIDSERTGRTDAKLSRDRFVSLIEARLTTEGHSGQSLNTLAQNIVEAASQRLVFLVEVESEQIGFEIRSLQEFMAAESLMDGDGQNITRRLEEIAPIPFWRNVFLFAAGKCFAERQELREDVHSICAALNELHGDPIAGTYLAGSDLAVALLEEGSSRRQPRFENLLARIAMRALDVAKPGLQMQLAEVYEPRMQAIYEDEIGMRLTGSDRVRSFGAWNCLLGLVARNIPWAMRVANENWPIGQEEQICVLQALAEPAKGTWAADRLLRLMPRASVTTLLELFQSEMRHHWLEGHAVEPEQEAAMSVLQSRMGHIDIGPVVNVLNTGVSYGSIVGLSGGGEGELLKRFRHMENWHPSWHAYKVGGKFLEAPSKENLASSLFSLAGSFFGEGYTPAGYGRAKIPWPILACLDSCTNRRELLCLAERAAQGDLGDVEDWIAAESRWFDKGIARDDLLSMTDDRLPFDARIREAGFPTNISTLGTVIERVESRDKVEEILDIYLDLPVGKTRSFVARTINWLILAEYWVTRSEPASSLSRLDTQTLEAVYRDVPSGSFVPLHMMGNYIGKSVQEIGAFVDSIREKKFRFGPEKLSPHLARESVKVLRRAYIGLNENTALLPLLAGAAEGGHLAGQNVEIGDPKLLKTPGERLAAFIITLSQETWRTDNSEQLIAMAREGGDLSGDDFNRIVNTLSKGRASGDHVDRFAVALKRLLPLGDYVAHQRYVNLLDDVLRRRTSEFADSSQSFQFALPAGMIELLNSK